MKVKALAATLLLAVIVITVGLFARGRQDIYISEVCPHNSTVRYDDIGYYSDYIVITNASDAPVNLEGYRISDDKDDREKYVIPYLELEAGASVTIWAAVPDVISEPYVDENSLYTNFKLRDLEAVFLTDPDGLLVDSVRLPRLDRDEAFVKSSVSSGWKIVSAAATDPAAGFVSDDVPVPVFSMPGGFIADPFELSIAAEGCEIFVTLDGSDPYTNGIPYMAPFFVTDRTEQGNYLSTLGPISLFDVYMPTENIDKATVIRAIARRPDGALSKESTVTYFVGTHMYEKYAGRPILSMVADPQDLFSGEKGIYVTGRIWEMNEEKAAQFEEFDQYIAPTNYNMRGNGWRRHARVELFDGAGQSLYNTDAKIGIRGNYTRYVNQKSFSLFPEEPSTSVFAGLFPEGGNTLMVRTGGTEDMFLTNFRDEINNKIAENLAVGAQKSIPCQLFLNGEYWGCYNLQDRLDESFVAGRYGVEEKNVLLIKNSQPTSGKKADLRAYRELTEFVETHDMSDDLNYRRFCNMMDIDNLIDYYCAEIFFANDDAYDNNKALWRVRDKGVRPYEDGKWRFLLFDTDCSDGYRESSAAEMDSFVDGHCRDLNPDVELFFSNLSKNPGFRERFRNRFLYLLQNDFSYERIGPILDGMEETYTKPMTLSLRRFVDPNTGEDVYRQNVQVVRDFFSRRGGYICEYLMKHLGD